AGRRDAAVGRLPRDPELDIDRVSDSDDAITVEVARDRQQRLPGRSAVERQVGGEPGRAAAVRYIDLVVAVPGAAKSDLVAVWRPGCLGIERGVVSDVDLAAAIGEHHINFGVAVPIARKDDLAAVRRPIGEIVASRVGGEPGLAAAVGVHHVDLEVTEATAKGVRIVPVALKNDLVAIPRPGRTVIDPWVVGDIGLAAAVGVHHVDLAVAVPVAAKSDLAAIRRPVWISVEGWAVGELGLAAAVGVHDVDIVAAVTGALEGDLAVKAGEGVSRCAGPRQQADRGEYHECQTE